MGLYEDSFQGQGSLTTTLAVLMRQLLRQLRVACRLHTALQAKRIQWSDHTCFCIFVAHKTTSRHKFSGVLDLLVPAADYLWRQNIGIIQSTESALKSGVLGGLEANAEKSKQCLCLKHITKIRTKL